MLDGVLPTKKEALEYWGKEMKIQRYKLGWVGNSHENEYRDMVPDDNGEFIRLSDVEPKLKRLEELEKNDGNFVEVQVDMDNEMFFRVAFMAHLEDITFNKKCNNILKWYIEEEEKKLKTK